MRCKTFIILYFLLSSFVSINIYEVSAQNDSNIIRSFNEDLTGDGLHETIHLKGELLANNTHYYRNIWLSIVNPFKKEWKISLMGGYDPNVQFVDLNHDNINDVFYKSKLSEDDSVYQYNLYSLARGEIKQISLPKQQFIRGRFNPNFEIELQLSPYNNENKNIVIDVSQFKEDYILQNIYDNNGNIVKRASPYITNPILLEPIIVSENKGHGLKSLYIVKDNIGGNKLGEIETLWYFQNNSWVILRSKWSKY